MTVKDFLLECSQSRFKANNYYRVSLLVGKKKTKTILSGHLPFLLENLDNDVLNSDIFNIFLFKSVYKGHWSTGIEIVIKTINFA